MAKDYYNQWAEGTPLRKAQDKQGAVGSGLAKIGGAMSDKAGGFLKEKAMVRKAVVRGYTPSQIKAGKVSGAEERPQFGDFKNAKLPPVGKNAKIVRKSANIKTKASPTVATKKINPLAKQIRQSLADTGKAPINSVVNSDGSRTLTMTQADGGSGIMVLQPGFNPRQRGWGNDPVDKSGYKISDSSWTPEEQARFNRHVGRGATFAERGYLKNTGNHGYAPSIRNLDDSSIGSLVTSSAGRRADMRQAKLSNDAYNADRSLANSTVAEAARNALAARGQDLTYKTQQDRNIIDSEKNSAANKGLELEYQNRQQLLDLNKRIAETPPGKDRDSLIQYRYDFTNTKPERDKYKTYRTMGEDGNPIDKFYTESGGPLEQEQLTDEQRESIKLIFQGKATPEHYHEVFHSWPPGYDPSK